MTDSPSPQPPALSPRQRRLMADYEAIRAQLAGHPHIRVEPLGMVPPELYRVTYSLKSLRLDGDQPFVAEEHVVDLRLPLGYPREAPLATPKTEVFHPNIDATKYCIGDYWAAGQTLADIITKIGDMLQFRVVNVKAPLNAVAARWVTQNEELLPIGRVELGTPEFEIEIRPSSKSSAELVDAEDGEPEAAASTEPEVPARDEPEAAAAGATGADDGFTITLRSQESA